MGDAAYIQPDSLASITGGLLFVDGLEGHVAAAREI